MTSKTKRSKADMQAEIKWLYERLHALILETNPILWHHAGLYPSDVERVKRKAEGSRE